jgi:hypothetical protein
LNAIPSSWPAASANMRAARHGPADDAAFLGPPTGAAAEPRPGQQALRRHAALPDRTGPRHDVDERRRAGGGRGLLLLRRILPRAQDRAGHRAADRPGPDEERRSGCGVRLSSDWSSARRASDRIRRPRSRTHVSARGRRQPSMRHAFLLSLSVLVAADPAGAEALRPNVIAPLHANSETDGYEAQESVYDPGRRSHFAAPRAADLQLPGRPFSPGA